ncbi:hypothetical protein FSP39_005602 [Pinctada imbricata]|uniref:Vitellogenin domain-containing protein n=1 Tax=Pinctada imbricata TaxID=66713 RepID=A0AA88XP85_PINIB|nr:hypothetical protein FSP39_005602 [Pinctada imbricata]
MDFKIFTVLVLIAGTYAGPVKQNLKSNLLGQTSCAKQCTAKSKFGYQDGQLYEFSYEAETKTGVHGASDEQAGLKIVTTAEIEVLSKCELSLQLRNTAVYGSDPNIQSRFIQDSQTGEFKSELEQYPLRFSFQDGIIEELCPTLEESSWSLNVKRGILSAFQNSMDSFDRDQNLVETDVIGKCRTDYKISQTGWRSQTVKKSKDMISCTERHGYESSIKSSLYNVPANVRSLPLLKSTHECDQEISADGHIQNVECHEMHIFRPFSKGNSGAMTEVTQKLKFVSKKAGGATRMAEVPRRADILFEHSMGEKEETSNKKAAEDKLRELCSSTEQGIQSNTPRLFSELVYLMKKLNANAMDALYKEVKKASFCPKNAEKVKKFYLDAIPMVGTGAAIRQITQLILNKDITGKFADAWLTSITFIQHPTKDMISELAKLLNTADASRVLLSLSTLTASYCKLNPGCDSEREVIAVLDKLQTNLGMDCSGADKSLTLLTLRAIGNIEQSQRFVPTLENCFGNKQNPTEIRVAAVEAYRKMSCGADRNNLMALYRNNNEDSEIRVMAYLQVMKCPSDNVIQQVKDTLQAEEVNQVGSFVWTHLTNLMETSSPLKQSLKAILEDHDLPKKFDLDQRKFSRNYDWSYFSESMNAGGSIESNLVWSTESFLPRSGMANLTVDMFGRSVNLLEVGGRMEGLDYLLESYFGPSGSLNDGTISPGQNNHGDLKMKKLNKIDDAFNKKVQELKGAMYIRVFGNEIIYQNLDGQSNKPNGKGFNILEMFMELKKDHDISYTKSSMFLDSSVIVPTVIGLPLNLTINGTATVNFNAKGKMDLGKPSKVILIEGELAPSGAVEFSTVMSVDAFVTKSGMKMTSTLHTSTAFSGKVEIKEKDDITLQFNVPQQKSEILSVQSSFFTIHKDQERKQKMIANKEIKRDFCSGYTMGRVTGLELCGKLSYVNASELPNAPYFPLTGPVNLVLEVEKRDTHTGYRFQLKKINNRKQVNFKVFYDTPGGKIERATGFELDVNKRNLVNNKNMKKVSGIATVDDTSEYRLVGEIPIEDKKNVIKYKPKLEIMYPDRDPITIIGNAEYQKRKSLTSNLQIIGVQKNPITLESVIKYTDKMKGISFRFVHEKTKMYTAEVMVRTDIKKTRWLLKPKVDIKTPTTHFGPLCNLMWDLKGVRARYKGKANFRGPKCNMRMRLNIDKRAKMIQTTLKADYNFAKYIKNAKDNFQFISKVINKSTKTYKNVNLKTNFKSGRFADYNNQLVVNMDHRFNKLGDLEVVFDYGKNFLDKQLNKKKIAFQASAKYSAKKNFETANVQYNVTMKYPAMGFSTLVVGKHFHTKKNVKSFFSVQYDNKKQLEFGIKFSDETKNSPNTLEKWL